MEQIAVYGGGGFAREVAWLVERLSKITGNHKVVCYIDDNPTRQGMTLNSLPVVSLEDAKKEFNQAKVIIGVGSPKTRELLVKKTEFIGFETTTLVDPDSAMSQWVEIGVGTVICAGNILTCNIRLGKYVQINLDCTVGHDVVMDDFVTIAPGVHISGYVHLRKRVYVGTGAVIINGTEEKPLEIGNDVVIGAGACVVKSVESGHTVVGVPAKSIGKFR